MLISAKTMWWISSFSSKEVQLIFRQWQKYSARNIVVLKCQSQKQNVGHHGTPLMQLSVKGTISDPKFQTSLFSEPPEFLHIQREFHYNKVTLQQFSRNWRKQHTFGKRDNSLLLGINFCRQKLIQGSISSNKSFNFGFS